MRIAYNIYKSQKLIRVMLEYDEIENTIIRITISGDFFLYPEEALEILEAGLVGKKLDRENLEHDIECSLKGIEVYGFNPTSLTEAILGCKR
jgi:lipoate-protein ligase A